MSNRYTNNASCVDKLYKAYLKHRRVIVAVDFDCTVFDYENTGDTYEEIFALLKRCQDLKFFIVCYTCRSPQSYQFIYDHFFKNGIAIQAVNHNVIPVDETKVPETKIYYNILLDDKAGLGQAMSILDTLVTKIENK